MLGRRAGLKSARIPRRWAVTQRSRSARECRPPLRRFLKTVGFCRFSMVFTPVWGVQALQRCSVSLQQIRQFPTAIRHNPTIPDRARGGIGGARGRVCWAMRDRVGRRGCLRNGQMSQWRRGMPGFPPAREMAEGVGGSPARGPLLLPRASAGEGWERGDSRCRIAALTRLMLRCSHARIDRRASDGASR